MSHVRTPVQSTLASVARLCAVAVAWGLTAAGGGSVALAQKTFPLPVDRVQRSVIERGPHLLLRADPACGSSLRDVLAAEDWTPTDDIEFYPLDRDICYWLQARVSTPVLTGGRAQKWMAEVGFHGRSTLFVLYNDSLVARHEMGNDLPIDERAYPHIWSNANQNVAPLTLAAGTDYRLLLRYANPRGASLYGTADALAVTMRNVDAHDARARLHLMLSGLMVGGLLLLMLYQTAQWTVYRTELDLTYCLMLLGLLSFVCYDDYLFHALFSRKVVAERWLYLTGSLGLLGFFRFAQLTLRAVDYQASRDRLLGWLVTEKAIEAPLFLLLVSFEGTGVGWLSTLATLVPETFRLTLIVTLLIFSYAVVSHFRVNRDKATYAFLFGNFSLVLGVLLVTLRSYLLPFDDFAPVRWYLAAVAEPFDYIIEIGIVGMALCFAFAVALLTKDREALLEREFNQRLVEVRMEALRSQMNPHFLFNGLNSIKLFVIDNQPRLAGDYLSRFARLIRLVLENSKAGLITLTRELETLELYVRMESLRFAKKFTYDISVEEDIEGDFVYLPPTLLQPYVENAIWHGLLHREDGGGHLQIEITKADAGRLRLVIADDGVGRAAAERYEAGRSSAHKSLGMQITAERIAMLRSMYGFEASVTVDDRYDAGGAPAGTRVTILLTPGKRPLGEEAELASAGRRERGAVVPAKA